MSFIWWLFGDNFEVYLGLYLGLLGVYSGFLIVYLGVFGVYFGDDLGFNRDFSNLFLGYWRVILGFSRVLNF